MSGKREALPEGWAAVFLRDIARVNPPLDRSIDQHAQITFVPMRSVEVEGGGLVRPETRPYSEVKKGYTSFLSGDVIMAKITPCMENGKIATVPEVPGGVCFGSTEFHVLRPENGIQARWIERSLLQHEVRRAAQRQMTGGVGQMRVPSAFLETVWVPLAPISEQARIADALEELFSALEAGVAALARVRERLKLYRASVLKAAVEGALIAERRSQHPNPEPALELLQRILAERHRRWEEEQLTKRKAKGEALPKNWKAKYKVPAAPDITNLPLLPDGWCWASWEQAGISQNGRPFPSRDYRPSGTKLLRPGNLYANGKVGWTDRNTRFMPHRYAEESPDLMVGGGELVMNLTAQSLKDDFLGRVCITPQGERCLLNQRVARLTPLVVLPKFMLWVFKSARFREFVATLNTGSLIQHMFTSQLGDFVFPLPPIQEQEAIVEAIEDQFSVIDHLEVDLDAKVETAQALRQAILRHAFSGKLVPQDPNDEPASELLKRIAAEREARDREAAAAKRAGKLPAQPRRGAAKTVEQMGQEEP